MVTATLSAPTPGTPKLSDYSRVERWEPSERVRAQLASGDLKPTVVVLVPAHNEQEGIARTVRSLLSQSYPPTRIVVAGDNCTDDTLAIAGRYPVTVMETVDNPHRKSGALNQAWLRYGRHADAVLTMDADTVLSPDTLEEMVLTLYEDRSVAAVCARYWAREQDTFPRRLQRLEYARYDDTREIRGWRIQVASGAAALYRNTALFRLPEVWTRQGPWDNTSLIEDYALTLDLKALGFRARAAEGAHVLTDTPDSFSSLWQQRQRWGRGGFDECRKRGWAPETRRDISAYGLFAFGLCMRLLFIVYLVLVLTMGMGWSLSLIGLLPLGIMWLERVTSAWRLPGRTWRDMVIVLPLVVEDAYGLFLEACTTVAISRSLRGDSQNW